jgi:hypothetical protein
MALEPHQCAINAIERAGHHCCRHYGHDCRERDPADTA